MTSLNYRTPMSKFFLVKGNHTVQKIIQKGSKAYAVTDNGTYKIRENLHSNSFVVYPEPTLISRIYELSEINYREVYNSLEFTNFNNLLTEDFTEFLKKEEIRAFCKKFYVFYDETRVAKIEYKEVIRIIKYMQSCGSKSEFNLYKTTFQSNIMDDQDLLKYYSDLNNRVRDWAFDVFTGDSTELGFFILLENLNTLENFVTEWKRQDLYDISLRSLISFVENSFLDKQEQLKIKTFISRLI